MITKKQGTRFLISILFLSLIWVAGKKSIEATQPSKEGIPVTFTFTLPSMSDMLGPTGETDLYTTEPNRWASHRRSREPTPRS